MSRPSGSNHSTNAHRHPYLRDDLWANGFYDFLWGDNITEAHRERLNKIKMEAIESKRGLVGKHLNQNQI